MRKRKKNGHTLSVDPVNVLNLHIIDIAKKNYTHLHREKEKEEGEKE
jgi:hypothetical protein